MLKNGEKKRFAWRLSNRVAKHLETFLGVIQIEANVVKTLGKFVEILIAMLFKDFQLQL